MSGALRVVTVAATSVAALWLVLAAAAFVFQRQLIYLPDRNAPPAPPGVEEVTLTTQDGLALTAWFVASPEPAVSTVLVTPGNAGSRSLRLPLAHGLAERGHAVLLLDYRGYGGNPGRPDAQGLLADAAAARRHLQGRPDVAPDRIVHLGESIGTGVAAALTAQEPPAALVLRSPFPSLAEVAARHYPFLPVRSLLRERFPVTDDLAAWEGPTLVVAGTGDRIVPPGLSGAVADATGAEVLWLEGVDHNDRELLDGATYLDGVDAFIRTALDGAPTTAP
ncbi:alpha/beta hydrolase [Egicoccus sp. AB-alg6-2]|uniref:alpha/beta hydrolase n=1 Tax=Egicoccus sp. AB-alg6-2 TaxID=3242692 RepID=UPI00359ED1EF